MTHRRKRYDMTPEGQAAFLAEAGEWRRRCVTAKIQSRIHSPVYDAAGGIMAAIDTLAEAVMGRRDHFHGKSPRTPGPDLPPLPSRDPDETV